MENIKNEKPFSLWKHQQDLVDKDPKKHLLAFECGTGKTLTAFSAALKLRKRIENKLNYKPRIIYALPFINIIEQNYAIIKSVLKNGLPDFKENETQYLLKHHHLADISYKTEGTEKNQQFQSIAG